MKKMYVPFTRVSVDPEIQRMRDMLTSGENLVIDDDGSCQVDLDNYNTTSNVITVENGGDFEGFRTAAEMTDYIQAINEGYSFEQVD